MHKVSRFAAALRDSKPEGETREALESWVKVVVRIADVYSQELPKFNRLEFYRECRLGQ